MLIRTSALAAALALAPAACGGDSDDPLRTGSEGGPCYGNQTCDPGLTCVAGLCADEGGPLPTPGDTPSPSPTPGATPTPTPSGDEAPFGGFALWRSGCGDQLWARWRNTAGFGLVELEISRPGGSSTGRQFGEVPTFSAGFDDVMLLTGEGENGPGTYTVVFTVSVEQGAARTVTLVREAEERIHREGAPLDLTGARWFDDRLHIVVEPAINGYVDRLYTYRAGDRCLVNTRTLPESQGLVEGAPSEIDEGGTGYAEGDELVIAIEGVNVDLEYTFYGTVDVTVPQKE